MTSELTMQQEVLHLEQRALRARATELAAEQVWHGMHACLDDKLCWQHAAWTPNAISCNQVRKAAQADELRKRAEEVSHLKFGRPIELQVG